MNLLDIVVSRFNESLYVKIYKVLKSVAIVNCSRRFYCCVGPCDYMHGKSVYKNWFALAYRAGQSTRSEYKASLHHKDTTKSILEEIRRLKYEIISKKELKDVIQIWSYMSSPKTLT